MPRKTRRQKLKATQKHASAASGTGVVKREFEFEFAGKIPSKIQEKKIEKSHYLAGSNTIVRDLTRTIVIACLLFSLELVIYSLLFK